jgi:hypothetical protein
MKPVRNNLLIKTAKPESRIGFISQPLANQRCAVSASDESTSSFEAFTQILLLVVVTRCAMV